LIVPEPIRFLDILEVLCREEVEFVLVGGVAAILAGAPVSTFDLDIVFRNNVENRQHLLRALRDLDAVYLDPAGRQIAPDLDRLETMDLHRFGTKHGVLDVLTEIGQRWSYSELAERSREYRLADTTVQVLELAALIEAKAAAGREKDLAVLPVLRRTLELKGD
jgi:hypothetical protein